MDRIFGSDSGVEMRMVLEGDSGPARVDLPLLKAVSRARRWSQDLMSGRVRTVSEMARREELDRRSVHRLLPLGFLSPRIVAAIAEGRQPPDLTVIGLTRRLALPLLWRAGTGARRPLVQRQDCVHPAPAARASCSAV